MKDGLVILVVRNEDGQRLARNSEESFRKFDFNCYFFRNFVFVLLARCESGVIKDTPLVLISQVSVRLSCYLFILVMLPPPFTRFVMIYRIEPHQFGLQLRFVRSFRDH